MSRLVDEYLGASTNEQATATDGGDMLATLERAISATEASGDDATSPKGARGRMQVMPATFRQYAQPGEDYNNDEHRTAVARRKIADDYQWARTLSDDPDEQIGIAAAAYQGGRGGAMRWLAGEGDQVSDGNLTINQYVDRMRSKLARLGQPSAPAEGAQPSLVDDYLAGSNLQIGGGRPVHLDATPQVPADNGLLSEGWKGLKRGIDVLQATGYGFLGAAGDKMGSDALRDYGLEGFERNIGEAGENAAAVGRIEDIGGVGDFLLWSAGALGEVAPMFIPGLGLAGMGARAATSLGGRALAGYAEQAIAKKAAELTAKGLAANVAKAEAQKIVGASVAKVAGTLAGVGAGAGSYGSSAMQEIGSIYGDIHAKTGQYDADGAIAYGAAAAILDALPTAYFAKKLGLAGQAAERAKDVAKQSILRNAGKEFLKGAVFEGATEGVQTAIENEAVANADQSKAMTPFSDEWWSEVGNAAAMGAVGGAAIGGLSGGVDAYRQNMAAPLPANSPLQKALQQGAQVQPQPPVVPPSLAGTAQQAQVLAEQEGQTEGADPGASYVKEWNQLLADEQADQQQRLGAVRAGQQAQRDEQQRQRGAQSAEVLAQDQAQDELLPAPADLPPAVPQAGVTGALPLAAQPAAAPDAPTPVAESPNVYQSADKSVDQSAPTDAQRIAPESVDAYLAQGADGRWSLAKPFPPELRESVIAELDRRNAVAPATAATAVTDRPALVPPKATETPADMVATTDDKTLKRARKASTDAAFIAQIDAELARRAKAKEAERIAKAAAKTNTQPTDGQKEAGNYKKGRLDFQGIPIAIENPKGSKRSGTSPEGKRWESTMRAHYGHVDMTGAVGADGDKVDVFIGPENASQKVFVIDQKNADGSFDEHKAMLGYLSPTHAKMGYLANYEKGWQGIGDITEMSVDEFKGWLKSGKTKAPLAPASFTKENSNADLRNVTELGAANAETTAAEPTAAGAAAANPSTDEAGTQESALTLDDELRDALAHLGDVLGDVFGTQMKITGPQHKTKDLLPALAKVLDLLVQKGFKSFKQAVGQAAGILRANKQTAGHVDAISPRVWKAAYNAIAEFHEGTDSEESVFSLSDNDVADVVSGAASDSPSSEIVAEIDRVIDVALSEGRSGNRVFAAYRSVSDAEAAILLEKTQIDGLSGYRHQVDEAAIRHVLKQHGDAEREATRGQLPVTAEDIAKLPEVTNPLTADSVDRGESIGDGTETIVYRKTLGDTLYVVEEVRRWREYLALKTMWKVRAAPRATSQDGVAQTSETFGAQPPHGEPSVAPQGVVNQEPVKNATPATAGVAADQPAPAAEPIKKTDAEDGIRNSRNEKEPDTTPAATQSTEEQGRPEKASAGNAQTGKAKKPTSRQAQQAAEQRVRDAFGFGVGDTVTFSRDVGYMSAGKPMVVDNIARNGVIYFRDPVRGSGTSENLALLRAEQRRGLVIEVKPAEAEPAVEPVTSADVTQRHDVVPGVSKEPPGITGVERGEKQAAEAAVAPTYEQAKAKVADADARMAAASAALAKYPKGVMGLTPDEVKATPEWQAAKRESDAALKTLQDANAHITKHFGAQLSADRAAEREAKLEAQNIPKIGDTVQRMGKTVTLAKADTIDGVRYELYNDAKLRDKGGVVRVVDEDSRNTVSLKSYDDYDQAEADYREALAKLAPQVGAAETAPATLDTEAAGRQWDAMLRRERAALLVRALDPRGDTDIGERYSGRAWRDFNAGERNQLAGLLQRPATPNVAVAAPDVAPEVGAGATASDRDHFTLERLQQATNTMKPFTFARGEYVRYLLNDNKSAYGEIDGISHARREFSVDGLWYPFGAAYKAERQSEAKPETVPLSGVVADINAKHGAGLTEADRVPNTGPYTLTEHAALMERINAGEASLAEYKAGFERLLAGREALRAEFMAMKKPELMKAARAYRDENKADLTKGALRRLLDDFVLRDSISYAFGADYDATIRNYVESETADTLREYAEKRQAKIAEYVAERQKLAEGIDNPKTLADFRHYIEAKQAQGMNFSQARMTLTPEQRAQYDELSATQSREQRKDRADQQRTQVQAAATTTEGQIIPTKHTKTGEPLFVVKAAERVEREVYSQWNATAKRLGGWYSSYRGGGAVPGFQFKTMENAEAFLKYLGGDAGDAKTAVQQRRDAYADDQSQSAVERLREMAGRLDERADEALGRDRKANTARRARFAAAAEAAANGDKALAQTMRNIAQAIESGAAKFLDRVRTKAQIDMLNSIVGSAQWDYWGAKYPSYADRERHKGEPAVKEVADYAQFPQYTAFRSDLAKLGRQLSEIDGAKKLGQRLLAVADDVSDAYLAFAKENLHKVSTFRFKDGGGASFANREQAGEAIKRSGYKGKAIVLPFKRGQNIIIQSPSFARENGLWAGDDDKRITLSADFGAELVAKAKEYRKPPFDLPYTFHYVAEKQARLKAMGIETPPEFRALLREFIGMKQAPKAPDRVKELERAMAGKRNSDGLDFFPTPAGAVQDMLDAAELKEGMSVLEPSAGMAHIADLIRDEGVEPDVVELSNERKELLEAKGYNVVGRDFMDMKGRVGFTYGDVFRAPDGKVGILQGAGGMGSDRVSLVDANGESLGYYDRDELEGVEQRKSGYDRILMNPPFSDRRDAQHVRHAFDLLAPGGRLVAIMGEGVFYGRDKKAQEFRDWLEQVGGTSEKLDEGTFLDPSLPVNTGVNARMVVIDKPDALAPKFSRRLGEVGVDFDVAADQSAARALNNELARYFNDDWKHAYRTVSLRDDAAQALGAFGRAFATSVVGVAPTAERFDLFDGVSRINGADNTLFVRIPIDNPVAVAGHELYHEIAASYPEVHQWFAAQAQQYLRNVPDYIARLNALRQDGEPEYTLDSGTEELLADFTGDSLTDPDFLQQLAEDNPGRFTELLNAVKRWLNKVIARLQGGRSDEFVTDIKALRNYLAQVLHAYAQARPVADVEAPKFMTAYRGSPSSPKKHQAVDVNSPEFKRWFGDSKVVDAEGKPLAVYHGTADDFESFNTNGYRDIGAHFGAADQANDFADFDGGRVVPVYLSIKNPLEMPDLDRWTFERLQDRLRRLGIDVPDVKRELISHRADENARAHYSQQYEAVKSALEAAGFDGIAYDNEHEGGGGRSYIAFRPEQIKSAISNTGEFSADNPNIMESRGEQAGGATPDAIRAAWVAAFGAKTVRQLDEKGLIQIVTTADELPPGVSISASGRALWNGERAYFVAERMNPATAHRELLHEIGEHYGLPRMLGPDGYEALLQRVRDLHESGDALVTQAWGNVRRNYPEESEGGERFLREVLAKIGELADIQAQPWWRQLLDAAKRFLIRQFGFTGFIKVADIQSMVLHSLKTAGRPDGGPRGGLPIEALASNKDKYEFVHHVLEALAFEDGIFRYAPSTATTLRGTFADIFPEVRYHGEHTRADERIESGADHRFVFETPAVRPENGGPAIPAKMFYVYTTDSNRVWIDVSKLEPGNGGSRIYAAVADFAYNTGRVFIGDPVSVSRDAVLARTRMMLASALKHGTTRHLDAAREQENPTDPMIEPLTWAGNDVEKTRNLLHTFVTTVQRLDPSIRDYRYNFATRQFEHVRSAGSGSAGGSLGGAGLLRPDGDHQLESGRHRGSGAASAPHERVGATTRRAAILVQSLVPSEGRALGDAGILEAALRWGKVLTAPSGGLDRLFSQGEYTDTPAHRAVDVNSPEFKRWFGDSKVVDAEGKPLVVYRGEHGESGKHFQSRRASLSFGSRELASHYAQSPNDRRDEARSPRVIPAYLKITNPLMHTADDPFIELSDISRLLGRDVAMRAARENGDRIIGTSVWLDEYADKYPSVDALLADNPEAIGELYVEAFPLFDQQWFVDAAKQAGFDGAIHGEYGFHTDSGGHAEYKVFDESQVKSAISNTGEFRADSMESAGDYLDAARAQGQRLVDFAAGANSAKTLSWWHKSLGTMQHVASIHPGFARVFEAVQRYMRDTARFAVHAEAEAPDLIPKGFLGKPISPQDSEAIAAPIFQATLHDHALSDEELAQGQFAAENGETIEFTPLSARQIGYVRQFQAAVRRSLIDMGRADIARQLAAAGLDDAAVASLIDSATDMGELIAQARPRLLALGVPEENWLPQAVQSKERVDALLANGYAPLMRFGKYSLYYSRREADPETGAMRDVPVYFALFETERERDEAKPAIAAALAEEYGEGLRVEQGVMAQQQLLEMEGMTPEMVRAFADALGVEHDAAYQEFLHKAVNNRSALKRLIHRKGTAGFSQDVVRVLASFLTGNAKRASMLVHMTEAKRHADAIERTQGDVKDLASGLIEYVGKPTSEANALRGFMFFHYLGGSIASALTNLTQVGLQVVPYLYQFAKGRSISDAAKAMRLAGQIVIADSFGREQPALPEALRLALARAEDEGVTSPHEIYQLMAEARGNTLGRSLGRAAAGLARQDKEHWGNAAEWGMQRLLRGWGSFFGMAEAANRLTAFIAAHNIAQRRGMDAEAAYRFAVDAVNETASIYNPGNRPVWARGAMGATLFTFKQFSIQYVEFMRRLWKHDKQAFAVGVATLIAAAGATGLPGVDDLDDLIDTFGQWLGYSTNTKKWRRQHLESVFGRAGSDFLLNGVSSVLPLDVHARLGLGNLIPGSALLMPSASAQEKGREFMEVLGPMGGLMTSAAGAMERAARGDLGGAVQYLAPTALRNAAQGAMMATRGYAEDSKGRRVVDVDLLDAAIKAVGFQPTAVSDNYKLRDEMATDKAIYSVMKSGIAEDWAEGMAQRDAARMAAARQRLAEWNRAHPNQRIVIRPQDVVRRARAIQQSGKERFLKAAPKELRAGFAEQLEEADAE